MRCSEIMTPAPLCCTADTTVDRVAQIMGDKDIGPVLVLAGPQSKKLLGLVTDRDLALKVVARGLDPKQTQVSAVMSKDIATCTDSTEIETALALMHDWQVRRIPVLNDKDEIVGIIAQADIATRLGDAETTQQVLEGISAAPD